MSTPYSKRFATIVPVALGCLLAAGCGSSTVKLSGQVAENGQPLTIRDGDTVALGIQQLDGEKTSHSAVVDKDGTFTVAAPLPPGKYRVSLTANESYEAFMSRRSRPGGQRGVYGSPAPMGPSDRFRGAFQGAKSPLTFELKGGRATVVLDVAKKSAEVK